LLTVDERGLAEALLRTCEFTRDLLASQPSTHLT
jgi:hypothetical protein